MNQERLMQVLLSPIVSEKSASLGDVNQVVFRVVADATKREIHHAVEKMFEVQVENVRVVNIKGKTKRFGARKGRRSDVRKAYVRLKEGQDINFMPSA